MIEYQYVFRSSLLLIYCANYMHPAAAGSFFWPGSVALRFCEQKHGKSEKGQSEKRLGMVQMRRPRRCFLNIPVFWLWMLARNNVSRKKA